MKLTRPLFNILLALLVPLFASASDFQHVLDDFSDIVIVGLLAIFIIAINIRAFYSGEILPTTLAMNGLLILIMWFRMDEDNRVFNLAIVVVLLMLSIVQLIVSKRRG